MQKSTDSKQIAIDILTCPECDDKIWSRGRHDMRYCRCGYCYVDGGRDYTRVGFGREGQKNPTPPEVNTRWISPEHLNNPYIDSLEKANERIRQRP